ncbi:N-acetylmuramoyl-L-alanine amidase [Qipengyuania sp. MTN3-11]|uniref:N-acetylmuramoyl-L-alanine amidase family protein n=1 Tax=Qipengyuania sp. MTN3-11 TaxID=3056557 RepID=UPI0036F20194
MAPPHRITAAAAIAVAALVLAGAVLSMLDWRIPAPSFGRDYVLRTELPEATAVDLPAVAGTGDDRRPLVVIDPGHGGHDPGASGQGLQEKTLVLELARALRDELIEQGGLRVALTREDDRYLLLEERFEIARRLDADLFLSIHADSAGESSEVAGASIYTLSNQASSEAARRFAERENASDRINGQDLSGQSDSVSAILVELSQRRTQGQSDAFARLIEREGEGSLRFHPQARRAAALKVLRAPDVPSVLFESGFITNEREAQRLSSAEGRQRFAEVMARAIRIYFARSGELTAGAGE